MDDYLVYTSSGKSQDFDIQGSDGSLWGPLMEKVWAKTAGYFENISGGLPVEVYDFILGAPSIYYGLFD